MKKYVFTLMSLWLLTSCKSIDPKIFETTSLPVAQKLPVTNEKISTFTL